jgi:hypothetical protein
MALPRKGSRTISVRGNSYRWKGGPAVTVVRLAHQGNRLHVHFNLLYAAHPKQVADAIAYALDHGWVPNQPGKPFVIPHGNEILPEYPLWHSVAEGEETDVAALLSAGADPNTKLQGRSVLRLAANLNKPEVVKVLLEAGADPDGNGDHWPPLTVASSRGYTEVTKLLLDYGADVSIRDKHGRTALWRAENKYIIMLLREAGAAT